MEVFALTSRRVFSVNFALVGTYPSRESAEAAAYELGLWPGYYEIVRLE
jgi:hypothetical protein